MDFKDMGQKLAALLVVTAQELSELDETNDQKHEDFKKIFKYVIEYAEDAVTDPLPDPIELIADMVLDSGPVEGVESAIAGGMAEVAYQVFAFFRSVLGSEVVKGVAEKAKAIKQELGV